MELILVRHGLPLRVEGGEGPADPGLAPEGHVQAARLADLFAATPVDAIYTSPMRRAVETAAPLADRLSLAPIARDGLAEFDRDLTYYVPLEELRGSGDPRWSELVAEWTSVESEEDRRRFRAVVVETVERVVAEHPSERVALVCHGGVVNAYLSHVLGLERALFFEPSYTSISRVLAARGGHRQLVSANETPHLPFAFR
ncbi:MAG: histidine phosphatase family protein [Actinobacteria bacterium]|nr:histidine phosphatase family protein [Actinomycetota bacterium]